MYIEYQGLPCSVFENGRVFVNGKERRHFINADGYPCVSLWFPEKGWRAVGIHRLIATAFIPNPENLPEVNHKDFDRTNFAVKNLEWVTHADNIRYSQCNRDIDGEKNPNFGNHKLSKIYKNNPGLAKEKQSRPGLQNGRCREISAFKNGIFVKTFPCILECMKYLQQTTSPNVKLETIRSRIRSSVKSGKAYKDFTFVLEDERSNDYPAREYDSCENPESEARST